MRSETKVQGVVFSSGRLRNKGKVTPPRPLALAPGHSSRGK